jgi:dsRNA-specific ribonuclease
MKIYYRGRFLYEFKQNKYHDYWSRHPSIRPNGFFYKLEFFGDRIVAYYLTKKMFNQKLSLKDRSIHLAELSSKKVMAEIMTPLKKYVCYTGNLSEKMLADFLEAFLGAIHLDGGNAEKIIGTLWQEKLLRKTRANPKNLLQEHPRVQPGKVNYNFINTVEGIIATAGIFDGSQVLQSQAQGRSKKEASIRAAAKLLKLLNNKEAEKCKE